MVNIVESGRRAKIKLKEVGSMNGR
jgi:hypothetical protein